MSAISSPPLTLAMLDAHDPHAHRRGREWRYLCPFAGCADHQRPQHRNLAVNTETGLWTCKRCGAGGKLQERWEPRERLCPRGRARRAFGLNQPARPQLNDEAVAGDVVAVHRHEGLMEKGRVPIWRKRWDAAVSVAGTPGEAYLASRGIPIQVATAAGVRYLERWGHWSKYESDGWHLEGTSRRVVFPIVDQVGELVGIQGRKIADTEYGEKMLTNGSTGVFATGGGETLQADQVAIVEAPIDALSLAAVGIPSLATCGTAFVDWLPRALAFKSVLLAHDNDAPNAKGERAGDAAAAKLASELRQWGASVERLKPAAKDWNQELQDLRLEALRQVVERRTARSERARPAMGGLDHLVPIASVTQPYPPVPVIEMPDEAEVDELRTWLGGVILPREPFQLWPWARVVDVECFLRALRADLEQGPAGPRWRPAVEDLRQLGCLFGQPGALERAA